jgi:hypothetical protein
MYQLIEYYIDNLNFDLLIDNNNKSIFAILLKFVDENDNVIKLDNILSTLVIERKLGNKWIKIRNEENMEFFNKVQPYNYLEDQIDDLWLYTTVSFKFPIKLNFKLKPLYSIPNKVYINVIYNELNIENKGLKDEINKLIEYDVKHKEFNRGRILWMCNNQMWIKIRRIYISI